MEVEAKIFCLNSSFLVGTQRTKKQTTKNKKPNPKTKHNRKTAPHDK